MTASRDERLQACSDWYSFHLSHVKDLELTEVESLWPECEKCEAVYESLDYTSHEGTFGLMTREVLENLAKVSENKFVPLVTLKRSFYDNFHMLALR